MRRYSFLRLVIVGMFLSSMKTKTRAHKNWFYGYSTNLLTPNNPSRPRGFSLNHVFLCRHEEVWTLVIFFPQKKYQSHMTMKWPFFFVSRLKEPLFLTTRWNQDFWESRCQTKRPRRTVVKCNFWILIFKLIAGILPKYLIEMKTHNDQKLHKKCMT